MNAIEPQKARAADTPKTRVSAAEPENEPAGDQPDVDRRGRVHPRHGHGHRHFGFRLRLPFPF